MSSGPFPTVPITDSRTSLWRNCGGQRGGGGGAAAPTRRGPDQPVAAGAACPITCPPGGVAGLGCCLLLPSEAVAPLPP